MRRAGFLALACCLAAVGCGGEDKPAASTPAATATASATATATAEAALDVAVDRRIELLSVISRLAGVPPFTEARTPYAAAVDRHFAAFSDHPAVAATRTALHEHGVSYDAPMALAVYLGEDLRPIRRLDPLPPGLDDRWRGVDLAAYLAQVRRFAADSGFERFEDGQAGAHADAQARFADVARAPVVGFFDRVFGPRPGSTYRIVPGLLSGPYSFGVRAVRPDGTQAVTPVMALDSPSLEFLAHEIAHSYVNPIFDARVEELAATARPLFATVEAQMRDQAYTTPLIMTNESVVRAVTVLLLADQAGQAEADRSLAKDESLGFTWTRELAAAIDRLRERGRVEPGALADVTREVFRDAL
jgi:hypothetical protein